MKLTLLLVLAFGAGAAVHAALAPGPGPCVEPLWPHQVLEARLDYLEHRLHRDRTIVAYWQSFKQFTEDRRRRREKKP